MNALAEYIKYMTEINVPPDLIALTAFRACPEICKLEPEEQVVSLICHLWNMLQPETRLLHLALLLDQESKGHELPWHELLQKLKDSLNNAEKLTARLAQA